MSRADGGPAFPGKWANDTDGNATAPDGQVVPPDGSAHMSGMTLRDYFAAKAMQAMVNQRCYPFDQSVGQYAYMVADAMLKARQS